MSLNLASMSADMFKDKCPSMSSLGSDGNTSFLRAARAGHLEKVLEYLQSNIDINTSNANGLNALHLASKDGHVEVVTELLKRGAVVDSATKKGNTALHIASLAGQEEVVRLLVQHGASVNVQSQNGFTPLYMAAQENHDSVVKFLLASGANQSLATEDGFTPLAVAMQQGHDKVVAVLLESDTRGKVRLPALHIAAKKDDVKAAKLLLENEHNPDVTSKSGFTPLHIASHYGNESIANLLVQKGADVNYAAKHSITPLHVAAKWGKSNMVALLLERGAHIEAKTRDGLTPLHCAARSGHEQVVDMLLERGAPISSKTKNGLAPLHMAAQGDHVDAARILLYHRAPVDEVTVDYLTALHVAAHCGHARVAKLLLDRQADANARALNGFTPLHIACKKNRIKVVELLLKHGASIGATTESGLTPLHVASFMGCMNIVIYLLQHEANPDVPTVRGETPLHLAARANQADIIRILLRNGAQVDARAREQQTPLHIASRLGNVDIVMLLLQHGAKIDTTTKDMYTALHIAAKEGQDEVAAVLLEHGASLSATTKKGFTPLHLAAKYGNMKVAKLLLQREAPVDAQGKNGVTPLHVASHYDHQNVALLLLDKGASPHATAKNGHTPLHISAKKNQMDIATTLLEYGAQANAESKAGFTPLHLSSQEGHTDMSSLLIEHQADSNHHAKNGLTPLHLCAQEDRTDVAKVLVKNGAEVDSVTKAGYTPLHVASHFGQVNMVRFLLQNGSDVKATTGIGYTPLHQAAQQGHANVVALLLENNAQANATTNNGQTPLQIAQKVGYISVIEMLKVVTKPSISPPTTEEKYRVVAPEAMHETFMSDSEEEGGEDTMLADQPYRYLTVDEMKSLGDDSLPIDVTRDERIDSNRMVTSGDTTIVPPQAIEDSISPQHITNSYSEFNSNKYVPDNVEIGKHPVNFGFLVSFLVDARGGAMRGCRHSGVRVIVPPRCAASPTRITCRYVKPQRTPHPPPLMEGEALASRVLELGPVGAKFLGPVILEVPHFAALRGKEREIVILRSDNGETWREHTIEASEDIVHDVLNESFEAEDLSQLEDVSSGRITRILTHDFPQYFAVVSRIRQEVHAIGPEGGMVSSTVVPQVQAVFPQGALTKKIKVGLQAQPIDPELAAKLLGHGVAVSPVVTVEPRRRKFHKAITLSMPAPRAHSQGMINQYSGSAPTLRLLCSITGGTTRAQWEDVTGSTPLTFVNDCVSFTTTVSARFWLMDCRNIGDATKMATELYREAIHVPFMAKFVVFAKRIDPLEARLRVFCMTDDKEDKTLEHQEHFTEVAKSRDVEVLEGKPQYIEFAGNLVPITKSGEQLQFAFRAFRENRLPFSVRVKDQHADTVGRCLFMKEPKVAKGDPPQQPICILNIVLPDDIVTETISLVEHESLRKRGILRDDFYQKTRITDISNLLGDDWVPLASELGLSSSEINVIKSEYPDSVAKQAQSMLRMWKAETGNKATRETIESALRRIGREDIIPQCFNVDALDHALSKVTRDQEGFESLKEELGPSRDASLRRDISLDTAVYERDIMKDSESVESLVQADKKTPFDDILQNVAEREESKYSAEEKVLTDQEREEELKKSVRERKQEIEKRLSEERRIPASTQRVEIVQEITTIKRQSLVEDKVKDGEFDGKPMENKYDTEPDEVKTVRKTTIISNKDKPEVITSFKDEIIESKKVDTDKVMADSLELEKKLATQKQKIEEYERTDEGKPQIITHARTVEITHKNVETAIADKRGSELIEGVSQQLEKLETNKKSVPIPKATEDLKSPKLSKTPPPSPADFIQREKNATIQEWNKPDDGYIIGDKESQVDELISQVASTEGTAISSSKYLANAEVDNSVVVNAIDSCKEKGEIDSLSKDVTKITDKSAVLINEEKDPILPDQDLSKEISDQKKQSKRGKGFFSSLKSLMGRSSDYSDSESERTDTAKKNKGKPKKKKGKATEKNGASPAKIGKPRCPSPEDQRKPKTDVEITINAPDEKTAIHLNLDSEPQFIDDTTEKVNLSLDRHDFEILDSNEKDKKQPTEKVHSVDTSTGDFKTNSEPVIKTEDRNEDLLIMAANWKELTNGLIQNEINFQGWPDDFFVAHKTSGRIVDELSDRDESANEKSDLDEIKRKKKKGFLKIFSRDKSEEKEKLEEHNQEPDSEKYLQKTPKKEEDFKKSAGFFGMFQKKPKRDCSEMEEPVKEKKKETEYSTESKTFSPTVQQQMMDCSHFLAREIELFHDVRPIIPVKSKTEKEASTKETIAYEPARNDLGTIVKFGNTETDHSKENVSTITKNILEDTKANATDTKDSAKDTFKTSVSAIDKTAELAEQIGVELRKLSLTSDIKAKELSKDIETLIGVVDLSNEELTVTDTEQMQCDERETVTILPDTRKMPSEKLETDTMDKMKVEKHSLDTVQIQNKKIQEIESETPVTSATCITTAKNVLSERNENIASASNKQLKDENIRSFDEIESSTDKHDKMTKYFQDNLQTTDSFQGEDRLIISSKDSTNIETKGTGKIAGNELAEVVDEKVNKLIDITKSTQHVIIDKKDHIESNINACAQPGVFLQNIPATPMEILSETTVQIKDNISSTQLPSPDVISNTLTHLSSDKTDHAKFNTKVEQQTQSALGTKSKEVDKAVHANVLSDTTHKISAEIDRIIDTRTDTIVTIDNNESGGADIVHAYAGPSTEAAKLEGNTASMHASTECGFKQVATEVVDNIIDQAKDVVTSKKTSLESETDKSVILTTEEFLEHGFRKIDFLGTIKNDNVDKETGMDKVTEISSACLETANTPVDGKKSAATAGLRIADNEPSKIIQDIQTEFGKSISTNKDNYDNTKFYVRGDEIYNSDFAKTEADKTKQKSTGTPSDTTLVPDTGIQKSRGLFSGIKDSITSAVSSGTKKAKKSVKSAEAKSQSGKDDENQTKMTTGEDVKEKIKDYSDTVDADTVTTNVKIPDPNSKTVQIIDVENTQTDKSEVKVCETSADMEHKTKKGETKVTDLGEKVLDLSYGEFRDIITKETTEIADLLNKEASEMTSGDKKGNIIRKTIHTTTYDLKETSDDINQKKSVMSEVDRDTGKISNQMGETCDEKVELNSIKCFPSAAIESSKRNVLHETDKIESQMNVTFDNLNKTTGSAVQELTENMEHRTNTATSALASMPAAAEDPICIISEEIDDGMNKESTQQLKIHAVGSDILEPKLSLSKNNFTDSTEEPSGMENTKFKTQDTKDALPESSDQLVKSKGFFGGLKDSLSSGLKKTKKNTKSKTCGIADSTTKSLEGGIDATKEIASSITKDTSKTLENVKQEYKDSKETFKTKTENVIDAIPLLKETSEMNLIKNTRDEVESKPDQSGGSLKSGITLSIDTGNSEKYIKVSDEILTELKDDVRTTCEDTKTITGNLHERVNETVENIKLKLRNETENENQKYKSETDNVQKEIDEKNTDPLTIGELVFDSTVKAVELKVQNTNNEAHTKAETVIEQLSTAIGKPISKTNEIISSVQVEIDGNIEGATSFIQTLNKNLDNLNERKDATEVKDQQNESDVRTDLQSEIAYSTRNTSDKANDIATKFQEKTEALKSVTSNIQEHILQSIDSLNDYTQAVHKKTSEGSTVQTMSENAGKLTEDTSEILHNVITDGIENTQFVNETLINKCKEIKSDVTTTLAGDLKDSVKFKDLKGKQQKVDDCKISPDNAAENLIPIIDTVKPEIKGKIDQIKGPTDIIHRAQEKIECNDSSSAIASQKCDISTEGFSTVLDSEAKNTTKSTDGTQSETKERTQQINLGGVVKKTYVNTDTLTDIENASKEPLYSAKQFLQYEMESAVPQQKDKMATYDDKIDKLLKDLDKNITIKKVHKAKPDTIDVESLLADVSDVPSGSAKEEETKYACYVTTPTMQRRGIGGSQRFPRGERPALIDVSHMPADESSEEDEYIVTEPSDELAQAKSQRVCSSPEVLADKLASNESRRRPLFHLESEEDESLDRGEQAAADQAAADVELIERKLTSLSEALDSLEQADQELASETSDGRAEHKLRRVERKFERIASETLDREAQQAKQANVTSPEMEAHRESEFQRMVSQLSGDEVSECQNLYSSLWADVTFTPSEEWDSKTPDSQQDVQDLPAVSDVDATGTTQHRFNVVSVGSVRALTRHHCQLDESPLGAGNWQQSMAADRVKTNIDIMTVGKEQEKDDSSTEKGEQRTTSGPSTTQQREVADQHQLSSEMKDLLAEMEKQAKN